MKGIDFDHSFSKVLVEPTLWLMFSISYTYHLTISITDVTNAFQYNLKAYSKQEIIDFPPHLL